jgi:hypothetical protein
LGATKRSSSNNGARGDMAACRHGLPFEVILGQ